MTFTLTKEQALRLAQLHTAGGVDHARPVLTHTHVEIAGTTLTATVTDSYRLAIMSFTVEDPETSDPIPSMDMLLPSKGLSDAIVATYKTQPKGIDPNLAKIAVTLDDSYHDQAKVEGTWDKAPTFTVLDETGGSTFPGITSLFEGQELDGRLRFADSKLSRVPEEATLPAFSGEYMATMAKLMGSTRRLRDTMNPWRMSYVPKAKVRTASGSHLRPWAFSTTDKNSSMGITYLLMPVRT